MVSELKINSKRSRSKKQRTYLCPTEDISENSARGFEDNGKSIFVVRQAGIFYIYLNRCPHTGTELNWSPNVFLTRDTALIICSTHGALFLKNSGLCVGGPCQGSSLKSLPFIIEGGGIYLLNYSSNTDTIPQN